ncbi:MAG: hypothetical protein JNK82_37805 [Myxococcaceae bacterium]|nr:hypothetical protein [Myxococcaceae bacterium]
MARDALVLDVAKTQWGLVSRKQALAAGMSVWSVDQRVRSGEWAPMGSGVYRLPGSAETWHQRAMAPCLQAEPNAVLTRRSAAYVWRLDMLKKGPPEPIEVLVPRGHRLTTHADVRFTRRFERGVYRSMPVTPLSRTLIDLATELTETELEMALDSAMRMGPKAMKALQGKLKELPSKGRSGIEALREMLAAYDGSLDSALEVLVRKCIFAAGLPKPVPQFNVWHNRRWIARVDFAWPKLKLVVQAHGLKWHLNRRRAQIDWRQNTEMVAADWHPLTTTWKEINEHPARFIAALRGKYEKLLSAITRSEPVIC